MRNTFNLAARPFVNRRPWRRLTVVLWALGAALFALNAVLYWGYLTGSADARAELAELRERMAGGSAELERLDRALARLDVESQNREVAFLNERIAERRFPWGRLFTDIEQVLPWNTRLRSLAPQPSERNRRRRVETTAPDPAARVMLDISGEAQGDYGHLELINSLYEHPSFHAPKLRHESRQDAGPLDFTIAVAYTPIAHAPEAPVVAATASASAPELEVATADPEPAAAAQVESEESRNSGDSGESTESSQSASRESQP